jgi:type IV pilus assembly protein PilP
MAPANHLSNDCLAKNKAVLPLPTRTVLYRCILTISMVAGLSACGNEETVDLHTYVNEVKARQKHHIPPLPKPQEFKIFTYNDSGLRNPFEPTVEIQALDSNNGLKPDMSRDRDVLEQYALGSLKMMGSLEKNGQKWALIRAGDGTLFRTTVGRHIGKNNGQILKITESQIDLEEIVPDGLGGWIKRTSTLAVSE